MFAAGLACHCYWRCKPISTYMHVPNDLHSLGHFYLVPVSRS